MCLPLLAPVGVALGASAASAAAVGTAVTAMGASTLLGVYGQVQQGKVAADVARNNQVMAEYAAQDAERRGEDEALNVRRQVSQVKGAQRARMAANGLDLSTGTAAELQDQTDFFGQQDAAIARNNGRRSAWSARASGNQAAAQGRADAQQSSIGAFSTLLGGATQVANKWAQYRGG